MTKIQTIVLPLSDKLNFINFNKNIERNHVHALHFYYKCVQEDSFVKFEIEANVSVFFELGVMWEQYKKHPKYIR